MVDKGGRVAHIWCSVDQRPPVCGLNRVYLEAGIRILDREKLPISLLCIQEPASK